MSSKENESAREGGHVIGRLKFKPLCDVPLRIKGICSVRDHQPTSHEIKPPLIELLARADAISLTTVNPWWLFWRLGRPPIMATYWFVIVAIICPHSHLKREQF